MALEVRRIISPMFDQNAFVVGKADHPEAFVIDPGFNVDGVLQALKQMGRTLAAILNTHGHLDHVVGNAPLKEHFPNAPILVGELDAPMLVDAELNLSAGYGLPMVSPPADRTLVDGEIFSVAGIELRTAWIPGHSPGHVVFIVDAETPPIVFGGDVLFAGSVGRTDFPNGSFERLKQGIEQHLFSLPAGTVVHTGHGPSTTIGEEQKSNPFLGQ